MTSEQPVPVLDDIARTQSVDRKNMLRLLNELPEQCETALGIGRSFACEPMPQKPNAILITGTGDSGIAGDIVAEVLADELDVPLLSQHGGRIPACIGEESLVFVVDYMGRCQTSLRNYKEATQRGARVICVTGGGPLREAAVSDGTELVRIPAGQPARTAIGYLVVPIPVVIEKLGLVDGFFEQMSHAIKLMKNSREMLRIEIPTARNLAKQAAEKLAGKVAIILGAVGYREVVADCWASHTRANAKSPAFSGVFPNVLDSEIGTWDGRSERKCQPSFVFLTDPSDRVSELRRMMSATAEALGQFEVTEIELKGSTKSEKLSYGIFLAGYVSYYLALLNSTDPLSAETVARIEELLAGEPEAEPPAE